MAANAKLPDGSMLRWKSPAFVLASASSGKRKSDRTLISAHSSCWRGDLLRRAPTSDDSYRSAYAFLTSSPMTPRGASFAPLLVLLGLCELSRNRSSNSSRLKCSRLLLPRSWEISSSQSAARRPLARASSWHSPCSSGVSH